MTRIGHDQYFMLLAQTAALRASCPRRQVGAVAVTSGKVVATGYNGSVAGLAHCCDPGVGCLMDGGNCVRTLHAETNCLAQAEGRQIEVVYCTTAPCLPCVKAMLSAGVGLCLFWQPYPSVSRDTFLEGVGLAGNSERGVLGWLRQIECPALRDVSSGAVPQLTSLYGSCAGGCGHVFSLQDRLTNSDGSEDDLGSFVCPGCHPSGWAANVARRATCATSAMVGTAPCVECGGTGKVLGLKRFIGKAPIVDCPDCSGAGKRVGAWQVGTNGERSVVEAL